MAFPTTGVLDNFNRANVGPPPSASWTNAFLINAGAGGKVVSNKMSFASHAGDDYWNPSTFGPDCEVFATIGDVPTSIFNLYLYLRCNNIGAGTTNGYLIYWSHNSGPGYLEPYKIVSGGVTSLRAPAVVPLGNGDSVGGSFVGGVLSVHTKAAAGAWTPQFTVADATFAGAGRIGIGTDNILGVFDDFGGGTVVVPPVAPYDPNPETTTTWRPLLLDDVLDGGPRASPFPPTNRGDNNPGRVGRYD